jgi:hypothetical protein
LQEGWSSLQAVSANPFQPNQKLGRRKFRIFPEIPCQLGKSGYPPRWFASRLASLKALWHDLNPPQVSDQLALEF